MKQFLLLLLTMSATSCSTTVYLVRHAEKLDTTRDTPLSEIGEKRAMALRDSLSDEKIDQLFATAYKRTQMTAKPLADELKLTIETYQPSPEFSEKIKSMKNRKVLIVGHSNTIPETIRDLTGEVVVIEEPDFDNLFIITIRKFPSEKISLTRQKYGVVKTK